MSDIQGVVTAKKRTPFGAIIVTIIALLIVGATVVAWFLGYLVVSIKEPSQRYVVQQSVCGDDIINRYNDAVGSDSYDDYSAKLTTVFEDVKKSTNYEKDATCLFVAYRYNTFKGISGDAVKAVDLIEQRANEGVYPSNKLVDIESIGQMRKRVTTVETIINDTNDAGGAG